MNNSDEPDQGVYKAVATNKEGEDICEAKLEVVKEMLAILLKVFNCFYTVYFQKDSSEG